MALLRRRKSTGAKYVPPPQAYGQPNGTPRNSTSTNTTKSHASPKVLHKHPSASTVRPAHPPKSSSSSSVPTILSLETIVPPRPSYLESESAQGDPKFSTADRTILKELKRNISARAAQFVIKGGPGSEGGHGHAGSAGTASRLGTKHHAYTREEVPYPRSYAREVLDL